MKKWLLIFFLLVSGVFIILPFLVKNKKLFPQRKTSNQERSGCISNHSPIFTHDITDVSKIKLVTPPGSVEQYGTDKVLKSHSYVVTEKRVPVYAPIDSRLIQGTHYLEAGKSNYVLVFEASCEIFYLFDHILDPVDKIKALFPKQPADDTLFLEVEEKIGLKAGELVGYADGGEELAQDFDFGVYDRTQKKDLSGLEKQGVRLSERDYQALCPYDVFPKEMKEKYYSLFGNVRPSSSPPDLFCK